jgi:mRNA interferase RelE/StbE
VKYRIFFHPGALREFDKLTNEERKRLGEVIDSLATEPRPQGIVKLTDIDAYRVRVGTHRIIYAIHDGKLVVLIVKVAHRSGVYREIETIKKRLKE